MAWTLADLPQTPLPPRGRVAWVRNRVAAWLRSAAAPTGERITDGMYALAYRVEACRPASPFATGVVRVLIEESPFLGAMPNTHNHNATVYKMDDGIWMPLALGARYLRQMPLPTVAYKSPKDA